MSEKPGKSSIHLIFFHMQSKELHKLTQQLCRLAKQEYYEKKGELPDDVRDDVSFDKIFDLIEHIEKSEFAKATAMLGDAYKDYQEMLNYIPRMPSRGMVCIILSFIGQSTLIISTSIVSNNCLSRRENPILVLT